MFNALLLLAVRSYDSSLLDGYSVASKAPIAATVKQSGSIRIYDLAKARLKREIPIRSFQAQNCCALEPNGKRILIARPDLHRFEVYDTETGKMTADYPSPKPGWENATVLGFSAGTMKIRWDAAQTSYNFETGRSSVISMPVIKPSSPDGRYSASFDKLLPKSEPPHPEGALPGDIASLGENRVRLFDNKRKHSRLLNLDTIGTSAVEMVFTPDNRLVVFDDENNIVQVFSPPKWRRTARKNDCPCYAAIVAQNSSIVLFDDNTHSVSVVVLDSRSLHTLKVIR